MGNSFDEMESYLTTEAENFIAEWENHLPYVVAHTSGSTGKPKEIRLLKTDMRASAQATLRFFNIDCNSHLHLPLSPDYIAGKMQIVRALEAKCSLTVESPTNKPLAHRELIPALRISMLPIVPSQIDGLFQSDALNLIDNIIIGGAPLPSADEQRLISAGIKAYATYGMTETCSHVGLRRLGSEYFSALPGFSFSTDSRSCLKIKSTTLSFGELTTNDIVELSDSQTFRWIGRFDNVINSGGIKISPEEIEKSIATLIPPPYNFYITSRVSTQWGEEPILVTDMPGPYTEFMQQIELKTGHLRRPKAIIFDTDIQFTASKKIIRKKF